MTKISIQRKLRREARTPGPRGRPIVIEIEYPNLLTFREKGRRTGYQTTAEACYMMAAKQYAAEQAREKKAAKKARREGRTDA